MAASSTAF